MQLFSLLLVREEKMSSDMDTSSSTVSYPMGSAPFDPDQESCLKVDPYLYASDHIVGNKVNEVSLPSPASGVSKELDFDALRAAISQFREARKQNNPSQGHFPQESVSGSPHQSFLGHEGPSENLMVESASVPDYAEISSSSANTSLPQACGEDEACPGTSSSLRLTSCSLNDPPAPALVVSPKTNFSDTSSDMQPVWSQTSERDIPTETQRSPNTIGSENDRSQESDSLETTTSEIPILCTSSSNSQSKDSAVPVMVGNGKHNSSTGLLPVPRTVAYGMTNPLVGVDRMLLQSSTLWPQGSVGLNSHGLSSQNGAIGLRSVGSSLGMVAHSGLRGFLPNSNVQMAWNNLAQGAASNVWGVQQGVGLGPVHRAQFIQNYAWHSNHAFHGNAYPPRRGGFGGW